MNDVVHFVFDLDDTLYFEEEYVRSALRHVGMHVADHFGLPDATDLLLRLRASGVADPIGVLWQEYGLPETEKQAAIVSMRSHRPQIHLRPDADAFLSELRAKRQPYAIVTDGRSKTQREKIAALGCIDACYISISEEVGLPKVDPERFSDVARRLGRGCYAYVADNPKKDFVAPNLLGWATIMLIHGGKGVHVQSLPEDIAYHPTAIAHSFDDIDMIMKQIIG